MFFVDTVRRTFGLPYCTLHDNDRVRKARVVEATFRCFPDAERALEKHQMQKLSTGPSRMCARGLYVNGNTSIPVAPPRPRAYACTWREACKAADYVLEHFGNPLRDRGIWVWYCQRLGLDVFLDLADEIISCWEQREIKYPVRAFQRNLKDTLLREARR